MKFYVLSKDGQKFGPADLATLNQWITEKRLKRDTELENSETGFKQRAAEVQGLNFPASEPDLGGTDPALKASEATRDQQNPSSQAAPYVANPSGGGANQPRSHYDVAPTDPNAAYSKEDDGSPKMITIAWVCAVAGFVTGCIVLPPFAIYQANRAKRMGNENGQAPLVVAWIVMGIHILLYGIMGLVYGLAWFAVSNAPTPTP